MYLKLVWLWFSVLGGVGPAVCEGGQQGIAVPEKSRIRRSDDAGPLEAVVDKLAQQVTLLNARVSSQSSEIAALKSRTDALGKTVAFYAWNMDHPIHAAPLGTLIFDHAETNVGHAYNTLTGVFTAPVSGVYHFQTTFMCHHDSSGDHAYAAIYVGEKKVAKGYSEQSANGCDQVTISSTMHINAGQQVYVKNAEGQARDYHEFPTDPYTTFSGFLLQAD